VGYGGQPDRRPGGCGWTGLVAQPLDLFVSEVEALVAQTRTAEFVCEEGWMVPARVMLRPSDSAPSPQ